MRAIPTTPYHAIIGKSFLHQVGSAAEYIVEFSRAVREDFEPRAIYFELNGFTINTDRWYFEGFAYASAELSFATTIETSWLCDWQKSASTKFVLEGAQDVQHAFETLIGMPDLALRRDNVRNCRPFGCGSTEPAHSPSDGDCAGSRLLPPVSRFLFGTRLVYSISGLAGRITTLYRTGSDHGTVLDYLSMRLRGRDIALLLIGAYAMLGAIGAWSDDPNADTPPIMVLMMMAMGFVFLGDYLIVMFAKSFSRLSRGSDSRS